MRLDLTSESLCCPNPCCSPETQIVILRQRHRFSVQYHRDPTKYKLDGYLHHSPFYSTRFSFLLQQDSHLKEKRNRRFYRCILYIVKFCISPWIENLICHCNKRKQKFVAVQFVSAHTVQQALMSFVLLTAGIWITMYDTSEWLRLSLSNTYVWFNMNWYRRIHNILILRLFFCLCLIHFGYICAFTA